MRAKIITWNPINTRTSALHSSVYIKPTLEILEFFNRSPNNKGVVRIIGTGSCYDNQNMFATIDKSSDVPNKRDNFFDSTGLYIITLNTLWYGFPLNNGYIDFQEGIVNDIIEYVSDSNFIQGNNSKNNKENNNENNKENNNENNNENNSNKTYSKDRYNLNNVSNDNNKDKKNNECNDSFGFDNKILIICGMSLILITILVLNNN